MYSVIYLNFKNYNIKSVKCATKEVCLKNSEFKMVHMVSAFVQ